MSADKLIYQSERMARVYANRPPIHEFVCERIVSQISSSHRLRNVLDAGCGAGASTAPLVPHAREVFGLDPFFAMVRLAKNKVEGATFLQGSIESLPFKNASIQLITTAGALNYTDVRVALVELSRVLEPDGRLAAYDFAAGRRFTIDSDLPERYAEFKRRFPSPSGYALDLKRVPFEETGLELLSYEEFPVVIGMNIERYVRYIMGETAVEFALLSGVEEAAVAQFCKELFTPLFEDQERKVVFEVQLALIKRSC